MKPRSPFTYAVALLLALVAMSSSAIAMAPQGEHLGAEKIVVANRASGSISVIDTRDDKVIKTIPLPKSTNMPEPMYVVYSKTTRRLFVGDRANDRVVAYDSRDWSVAGIAKVGKGVFHMWEGKGHGQWNRQLWVNNDIDKTTSVISSRSLMTITTIDTPVDIAKAGGKPHDVWVGQRGGDAYVSYLGLSGNTDVVVQFSTRTFKETARASVGKDPHLFLSHGKVYVPTQGANEVAVLERNGLKEVTTIPVPGAHGVWRSGRTLYVTSITAVGGKGGLVTIDLRTHKVIGTTDTPFAVPHNVTATRSWMHAPKIYVSHSGATAKSVSVHLATRQDPVPTPAGSITVGLNPFGITVMR